MPAVHARTIRRAAEIVGTVEKLGVALGVRVEDLAGWMEGMNPIPQDVFLKAVDIVVAHDVDRITGGHPTIDERTLNRPG